jgi:hypothetical protein
MLLIRLWTDSFIDDEVFEHDQNSDNLYNPMILTSHLSNDEDTYSLPSVEELFTTKPVFFGQGREPQPEDHPLWTYPGADDYPIWKVDCKVC